MNQIKQNFLEMKTFLLLWLTQSFSGLGSAVTSYALVIWSYSEKGSALVTALLMVCTYTPYVLCSVFAGALSDRWDKRRTMLVCDAVAAGCTVLILLLLKTGRLEIWHLYGINAVGGLMNTVQQPASEVAVTAVLPRKYYQKVGGLRYLSNSLNSILTPVIAMAVMGLGGMDLVIAFDLVTFGVAFLSLLLWIRIPPVFAPGEKERLRTSVKQGLSYLKEHRGILDLMMLLAAINLVASMYNAALPAMLLSREGGGQQAMGIVNTVTGIATLLGGLIASWLKPPKSRIRVICNSLLLSMSGENFLLAFGRSVPVWCLGAVLGWIAIPLMNTNLDAILRLSIPQELQGRVFAARNSFQFFTIPAGYFLGGLLVDRAFEPLMALQGPESLLARCFGLGKGSGAALFFAVIAVLGVAVCLAFRWDPRLWALEGEERKKAEGESE